MDRVIGYIPKRERAAPEPGANGPVRAAVPEGGKAAARPVKAPEKASQAAKAAKPASAGQ